MSFARAFPLFPVSFEFRGIQIVRLVAFPENRAFSLVCPSRLSRSWSHKEASLIFLRLCIARPGRGGLLFGRRASR